MLLPLNMEKAMTNTQHLAEKADIKRALIEYDKAFKVATGNAPNRADKVPFLSLPSASAHSL